jgi:GntR family transcriptional regulator
MGAYPGGMVRAWERVADGLRADIAAGRYAAGALPSGNELMAAYGVARQTVQTAIEHLRAEGLVVSVSGVGWRVAERRPVRRLSRSRLSRAERDAGRGPFMSDAAAGGFAPAVVVKIRREPASAEVAERLEVEPGTEVVVRERIMRADGTVVQLATSYLPADVAGGTAIEETDTGPGGTYARLEEAGHRLTHFVETVGARRATADEAALLQVPVGAPVLQVVRVAHAARPVEVNVMVLRSDEYELVYEIDAG